jgi:ATP-dependent phosphofructokinase / diphosphate-dependent phosphofructokinase
VLKNLEHLGVDHLIPIGGDDTLSYAQRMHEEGVRVVAIPKTMDNDVPGTDYCIGFSTCVTRTIELTHRLRTSAGSHERFLVIEVFGRYAGFTALLPTMAGAADRCIIPEHPFDIEQLAELMSLRPQPAPEPLRRRARVGGCAHVAPGGHVVRRARTWTSTATASSVASATPCPPCCRSCHRGFNDGRRVNVVNQRLGYLVRSGDPDALDSIVPMAFGNLALDLILRGEFGRLVSVHNGRYDSVPIEVVTGTKKHVDVEKYYNTDRLRPIYDFQDKPLFIMTSDIAGLARPE